MKKYTLNAQKRIVFGRKVKKLRADGQVPATIYGKNRKSISLSVKLDDLEKIYREAGESGLVELNIDNTVHPVLIDNVQINPVTSFILHAEFHQVDLKEKVKAQIPLAAIGEAAAVANKVGVLLMLIDEIEVEALPTDLPEKIEVDTGKLQEIGEELKVSDLTIAKEVTVLTDGNIAVAKIAPLVSKEAEAEAAAAAAAAAAKTAEAVPAAGEAAPAAGEAAPAAEKPAAAKPEAASKEQAPK